MLTKRNSNLPLICLVCGDVARGINFNVMSCLSCKTFFRRHGSKSKNILYQCLQENNCEITPKTRRICTSCRLNKCLTLGMDPRIIGSYGYTLNKSKSSQCIQKFVKTSSHQLPQPCTLNLLQNDHSTLSKDDWNLFSNIIHAYDATSVIPQTREVLRNRSILPPKLRSKSSIISEIFTQFFSSFIPFIQCTSFYHALSRDTYSQIVQDNLQIFGAFHAGFVIRESGGLDYPFFRNILAQFYTAEFEHTVQMFTSKLEINSALVKVILLIVAFSTNCGIVTFDPLKSNSIVGNPVSIVNVQNTIVTMFWKYLLYQYGFVAAVQRFSSHVQYFLNVSKALYERENKRHARVFQSADDTTRISSIAD